MRGTIVSRGRVSTITATCFAAAGGDGGGAGGDINVAAGIGIGLTVEGSKLLGGREDLSDSGVKSGEDKSVDVHQTMKRVVIMRE